jgi:hypothetical protein
MPSQKHATTRLSTIACPEAKGSGSFKNKTVPVRIVEVHTQETSPTLAESYYWKGTALPIEHLQESPSGAPKGGAGIVFTIESGSVKVYVWDAPTSTWKSS